MIKVAYIILHFNKLSDTLTTIDGLQKNKTSKKISTVIYLVDNGQDDKLVDEIKKYTNIILIRNSTNLGFAAGNNVGLKRAIEDDCDYLILLNNDTIVPDNLTNNILNSPITDKTVGAVSGLIYFAPGFEFENKYSKKDIGKVIWYAGGILDWNNILGANKGVNIVDKGQFKQNEETDFITGCLFVTKLSVVKRVGILDDRFCLYFEDTDWSTRIKKAGYKLIIDPQIKLWHKVSQSSGIGSPLNDYFITRNRLLFGFKHASLRTNLALVREAFRKLFTGTKAQKQAIRDFFTYNLGKGSWIK